MIVVDASAVVELLLGGRRAAPVEARLLAETERIQVPALLDAEVVQALRRLVRLGICDEARAGASVEILQDMPFTRHVLDPLLPRVWELRANLTAYDACYVALAEALECPLLTFDEGLAAAPGVRAPVVVPDAR